MPRRRCPGRRWPTRDQSNLVFIQYFDTAVNGIHRSSGPRATKGLDRFGNHRPGAAASGRFHQQRRSPGARVPRLPAGTIRFKRPRKRLFDQRCVPDRANAKRIGTAARPPANRRHGYWCRHLHRCRFTRHWRGPVHQVAAKRGMLARLPSPTQILSSHRP